MEATKNLKNSACLVACLVACILIFFGFLSVSTGLLTGLLIALSFRPAWSAKSRYLSSLTLQVAIVLMGFGLNINQVVATAQSTFLYIALSVVICCLVGWTLFRLLKVEREAGILITSGTAICGGSAIAAVSRVINSKPEHTAIAVTVVFLLNLVALFIFPLVGEWLQLSQYQFGVWAALAIHDTSSVIGAAAAYGDEALAVATTTKLARALWIIPLTLAASVIINRGQSRVTVPLFIICFVTASIVSSSFPQLETLFANLALVGRRFMVLALFLLGLGITLEIIKSINIRPLALGVTLWLTLASSSLLMINYL